LNGSEKWQHFIRNISGKSGDFTCSIAGEEVENALANKRPGPPSWDFKSL